MKILAKVSYFGKNFHGWQKQPNARSVQEEIEKVLSQILNVETPICGSGRTDAGVHAKGQTFHFECRDGVDIERLRYSANMLLKDEIHILSMKSVDDDFHARFSAKGKRYQYLIKLGELDPLTSEHMYYYPYPFDEKLFNDSIQLFIGKHNYQDFTSKEEDEDGFVREIYSIEIKRHNDVLEINLYGSGFMRYMIRNIIGTSLAVASNKESIDFINKHLDSVSREIVSYKAPSMGLYLIDVIY